MPFGKGVKKNGNVEFISGQMKMKNTLQLLEMQG